MLLRPRGGDPFVVLMARAGTADFCKEKRRLVPALPKNRPTSHRHQHRLGQRYHRLGSRPLKLRHFSSSSENGENCFTTSKPSHLAGSKAVKCSTTISVKGQDEYVSPASPVGGWVVDNFLVELSRTIAGNLLNSNLRARSASLAHFNLGQACLKDHAIQPPPQDGGFSVMASNVCLGFASGRASNQKLTLA